MNSVMDFSDIAIIMCAGKGTRMQSSLAKVLHKINGISMIKRVLNSVYNAKIKRIIIMVGDNKEEIIDHLKDHVAFDFICFIKQENPCGTGHCIQCAIPIIQQFQHSFDDRIVILSGDMPFISSETITKILHCENSILVFEKENPFGFGRVQIENDEVLEIIEEKDCTEEQKLISVVNCGAYCFTCDMLFNSIFKINNNNANHEYYLPDVIKYKNCFITAVYLDLDKSYEAMGVNTQEDLQLAIKKNTQYHC